MSSAVWVVRRLLFSTLLLLLSIHAVTSAAGLHFFSPYIALLWTTHVFFFELESHTANDALVQFLYPISLAAAFNGAAISFASISGSARPTIAAQWLYILIIPSVPLAIHLIYLFWKPLRADIVRAYRLRAGSRVWVVVKVLWALLIPLFLYLILLRWGGSVSPARSTSLEPKSTAFLVASLAAHAFAAVAFAMALLSRSPVVSALSSPPHRPSLSTPSTALYNAERTPLIGAINSTEGHETPGSLAVMSPSNVTSNGPHTTTTTTTHKKRPKLIPASAVPPDAPLPARLEALLVSPPEYEIISELMPLAPSDSLLRALVTFFDSRHQFMRLLKTFLLRDIRAAPSPDALLRDDSPAARLYQTYGALAAPAFLVPALQAPFSAFCAWAEAMHTQGAAPSSDLGALAMHASNIATAFMHALDSFPGSLRKVWRATHKGAVRRFGASADPVATNLIFLHFLCRALVFPENYGLLPAAPDAALRQNFFRPLSRLLYLASIFDSHPAPLDDPLMALISIQLALLPSTIHTFVVAARAEATNAPKARLNGPPAEDATMELLRYVSANYGLLKRHLEED